MSDFLVEQQSGVLKVTINHPERGNGMTDDMASELARIIDGAAKSSSALVLRGAGEDFCVGRLRALGGGALPVLDALGRRDVSEAIFNCYGAFRRAQIPIIGVVRGRALGFGCAIAALCDITLAGERAQFQVPEYAQNVIPTMVMSALVDRVHRKAMNYLVYSTTTIWAERALIYGLVSDVVPEAELDAAADRICQTILKAPRMATEAVKDYMRAAPDMAIAGAVDFARNLHATVNSSIEARARRS
ncbi:MAG TPA: enoyl-CoA hydratase/isomerase family protein [Xanthobacteraceae bacterium]|jgi:enoyl-CoA hydratase|nr:enoyl-CoA hydratase/isomerase family protein [Xanthobacteraceae bacterium]